MSTTWLHKQCHQGPLGAHHVYLVALKCIDDERDGICDLLGPCRLTVTCALTQHQVLRSRHRNDRSHSRHTSGRSEHLVIMHAADLREPLCHNATLILVNRSVRLTPHLKDPTGPNRPPTRRRLSQLPCAILDMRIDFCEGGSDPRIRIRASHRLREASVLGSIELLTRKAHSTV